MAATLTTAQAVLAQIAHALAAAPAHATVGRFRLRDAQRETCASLVQAMHTHGGALLADAPGSGKTVIALAVAARYPDVLVVAPAATREQWQRAAARAGVAVRLASHESLSRGHVPASAALIILDEAHHLRNPNTQRYRALATLAAGRHLLLLSATPVVNRTADRDALLSLFLSSRRVRESAVQQSVIVRRDTRLTLSAPLQQLPALHHAADVPGLGAAIAELPPPFPAADGSAATALMRMSLAMAWASSLAALDAALRRRLQRGQALAERLASGDWPTRHALGLWLHGDDATQLALPLAIPTEKSAPQEALAVLTVHLAAVAAVRARIAVHVTADTAARAASLRALLAREAPRRVLLLAHHGDTVRALHRALQPAPGVVAIVGQRVMAAAGHWTRDEVISALGPDAAPWTSKDPRGIRLILATDILSEGVELQGCATVVHGDLAWTPARLEQRVGRVARSGQRDEVHVTQFAVPAGAERLIQMHQRLLRKRRARTAALAVTDAATQLEALLADLRHRKAHTADTARISHSTQVRLTDHECFGRIAVATGSHCAFLALLSRAGAPSMLVAGAYRHGRWRVSTSADLVLHTLEATLRAPVDGGSQRGMAATAGLRSALVTARRLLRRWVKARRSRVLVHGEASLPAPLTRTARRVLDAWVSSHPLSSRPQALARAARVLHALGGLRGSGAEQATRRALANKDRHSVVAALEALAAGPHSSEAHPSSGAPLCLSALVILRPTSPDCARPAPSTGTAAPR